MERYEIGDILVPKFDRHKNIWPERIILGYDGNEAYLWSYVGDDEVFSSRTSSDILLDYYWQKK